MNSLRITHAFGVIEIRTESHQAGKLQACALLATGRATRNLAQCPLGIVPQMVE